MGSLYGDENQPLMCFGAAKSWQLGWYDDKALLVSPDESSWSGRVMGFADYNNPRTETVLLKIETGTDEDYFLNFNRKTGINSGTREAPNQVLVTKQGLNGVGYAVSSLVAKMTSGQTYTIPNFGGSGRSVRVKVNRINMSASPAYADVSVEMDCFSDSHCQRDAMFACSSYCNRNTNTCEMKAGCDCDYTCNSLTEDVFECPSDCLDPRTLETTRVGNDVTAGSMFDIIAQNEVQITGFEIDAKDQGTYINAYVYTKVGGYGGYQNNKAVWKQIQTARIESRGEYEFTKLPNLPNPIRIPAGRTQSFYVTFESNHMSYTNGQSEGRLYASDDNLEFYEGIGVSFPFEPSQTAQIWNGRINYVEVANVQLATLTGVSSIQGSTRPIVLTPPPAKDTTTTKKKRREANRRKNRNKRRQQQRRRFRRGTV